MRQRWREWSVNDRNKPVSEEYFTKARILKDVQSMKEAKYFSKDKLEKLIDKTIEREGISRLNKDISQKGVESERAIREGYAWQFHRRFRLWTWCVLSRRLDCPGFRLILLAVDALVIIGGTEGSSDLYPGTPGVSI